ncbi:hypothetical protein K435DRAFT_561754, partial [Dendrothele bispora CBS 962.96]
KYKPVHRKYHPVPTYMPDPIAQQFKKITPPVPMDLPKKPVLWRTLPYRERVSLKRMEVMLNNIEPGILNDKETDLLCYVVHRREQAFAFEFLEKGFFDRKYYPDYEIPVIEHTPWQRPPIHVPNAILEEVKSEIRTQELAGRFGPTVSSYRSAMFAVAKKKRVRLVINLEELNSVTVQDSSLPPNPNVNDFAEDFIGHAMYGLFDLFSGFN